MLDSLKIKSPYIYLLTFLWIQSLYIYIRAFSSIIVGVNLSYFLVPAIIVILTLSSIRYFKSYIYKQDVLFFIFLIAFYYASYLLHPENAQNLEAYEEEFIYHSLPFFLAGLIFSLDDAIEDYIYIASMFGVLFLGFYFLVYVQGASYSGDSSIGEDMMGPSYAVLPYTVFLLRRLFSQFNIYTLLIVVLGVFLILSFGTRGPLVCVLVFVAGYLLLLKKYKNPIRSKMLVLICAFIIYYNIGNIMLLFLPITVALGMSTRVIDLFTSSDGFLNNASGDARNDIIDEIIPKLNVSGYGIRGQGQVLFDHDYAHNIIYDFLIEYGYILGTLLLLGILILFIKAMIKSDIRTRSFLWLLFCISIIRLLLSHTYLIVPEFFLFLGYCIHSVRVKNKK